MLFKRLAPIIKFTPAVLLCLIINSCWLYSFKGTLPPGIKSIAIPLFEDRTAEFNNQRQVTDKIRLGFFTENLLKVTDADNHNYVLYGTILSIDIQLLVLSDD